METQQDSEIHSHTNTTYVQRIIGMSADELRKLEQNWKDHLSEAINQEHRTLIEGYIKDIGGILLYR